MKNINIAYIIIIIFLFIACKNRENIFIIRVWDVKDLYRKDYPTYKDTVDKNKIILYNGIKIDSSLFDSICVHKHYPNNKFSIDTLGVYEVVANTNFIINKNNYNVFKIKFIPNGCNFESFSLWTANKEIYIQLDFKNKKLFLLNKIIIKHKKNNYEINKLAITNKIRNDTIMFPIPPNYYSNQR